MHVYNSTEQYPATLIMIEGEYPVKEGYWQQLKEINSSWNIKHEMWVLA